VKNAIYNRLRKTLPIFPGEEEAIQTICNLADTYGYGNLIHELKKAWSKRLQHKHNLKAKTADEAAGIICVWCNTDTRTGRKFRPD